MDKIFDALFSPRVFFKSGRVLLSDSVKAVLVVWLTNVIVLYPTMKNCPFFGNYVFFSFVALAIFSLYLLWTLVTHFVISRIAKDSMWKLPFVFLPHIMSGWIFALSLRNAWIFLFFVVPVVWSTVLEFYFVRVTIGRGVLYTVILRIVRDVAFAVVTISFLRGWLS